MCLTWSLVHYYRPSGNLLFIGFRVTYCLLTFRQLLLLALTGMRGDSALEGCAMKVEGCNSLVPLAAGGDAHPAAEGCVGSPVR